MLLDNNYDIVVFILIHVFSKLHVHLYLWTKVCNYHMAFLFLLTLFMNKTVYFVHAFYQFSFLLFFKFLHLDNFSIITFYYSNSDKTKLSPTYW